MMLYTFEKHNRKSNIRQRHNVTCIVYIMPNVDGIEKHYQSIYK